MKPFKKMQKRLEARQKGCRDARANAGRLSGKAVPETALKMPGSWQRK